MKGRNLFRLFSALLALILLVSLTAPAFASQALGDDITAMDVPLNQQTQLSTNVFWSTTYSDYRTENLITYVPNTSVTPIVTYGGVLTDRSTVSASAKALESLGHRVVAGLNGDFYNVNNGLPIGLVVTDGQVRSTDAGFWAIGFRADGTAILGRPYLKVNAKLGYNRVDENGNTLELERDITAINKARTSNGIYLYTYDFNSRHTNGCTQPGIDVVCRIESGSLSIGGTASLVVEQVLESKGATAIQPGQVVLSASLEAGDWSVEALRNEPVGSVITLSITAAGGAGWNDVQHAMGSLYSLVEYGAIAPGLPKGSNPRTAVGQRADGTLIFYTIDGRKSGHSIGASMTQVAQRLIELGCVTALCLDGGGSTTLTVTRPTDLTAKRVNVPSDGGERAVTNKIFLVASSQPTGELGHFYVSADHPYVLAGSTVNISAAALDTNYIPMNQTCDFTASAGTMNGSVLTTPLEGGEIIVTASSGDVSDTATIHAITTPEAVAIRDSNNDIITSFTAAPETSTQLTATAAYHRFLLKADPAAFTWSIEGDVGTIDQNGLFTAVKPGTGKIIVSAGGQQNSVTVNVTNLHLESLEDFEDAESIFQGHGEGAEFQTVHTEADVRLGHGAGRLDYDLTDGVAVWTADVQPAVMKTPYNCLNLWVCGDGSGNSLSLLYSGEDGETKVLPIAALDFTGWKQFSLQQLSAPMTIQGLEVSGQGSGTIYLDQITASYDGVIDNAPPIVKAQLSSDGHTITGTVSDAVDVHLPAENVTIALNGVPQTGHYDAATGKFSISVSKPGSRVTVTARDASGNIGRASADVPGSGEHRFSDASNHWAADYCDFLYNNGISTGYADGTFRPNELLTRLDFAVMLYNSLHLNEADYAGTELPFADLASIPAHALPAVRALYAMGVINGSAGSDGLLYFNPNNPLTRAHAAAMIGRTQAKGYALAELTFTDAAEIPSYASSYIRSMVSQGILSGYAEGDFRPNANITRGQMAKIIYTML